jgi:hypothetical protein
MHSELRAFTYTASEILSRHGRWIPMSAHVSTRGAGPRSLLAAGVDPPQDRQGKRVSRRVGELVSEWAGPVDQVERRTR